MSYTAEAGTVCYPTMSLEVLLTCASVGGALTDTLDNLITERRIEPQLAMKILANFDKAVADVLAEKVKSRLTFKVSFVGSQSRSLVC